MQSINTTAGAALRWMLDGQPTSSAKAAFAWKMAAGAAMARATVALWRGDGVLVVRAGTDAWRRELRHARPMLTERMQTLMGPGVVRRLVIE